jgi:glyoxylase-like metal-dependent hydrolase (beta-lactamase superfamily II)
MDKRQWLTAGLALAFTACTAAKDAGSVLQRARTAMGDVTSISYSGIGMNAQFGYGMNVGEPWPRRDLAGFTRTINYDQRAMRDELAFAQALPGGQQQNQLVRGDMAWDAGAGGPVPQLTVAEERQLHIWLTPHGFVKAAMAVADIKLSETDGGDVITFTALGRYPVSGTIDHRGLVSRVATMVPAQVLGDTELVATYSGYREFDGIQFPTRIEIEQGGFPVWELNITNAIPNAPFDLPVPGEVQAATIPPERVVSTEVTNGVWHLTGGPDHHHSVLVEFDEYVAVVEAPENEVRSLAVIDEVRRLVPNKVIQYIVTTHHHFDHLGGVRTYVAEGATVVAHEASVPYFKRWFARPATLLPDRQGRNPRTPTVVGVSDKYEITDGKQTMRVYTTSGDNHTALYTLAYLPGPKVLVQNDAYSPGPGEIPPPAAPPENAIAFYDAIQPLKLDIRIIVPIHGPRAITMAEFLKFVGKEQASVRR